MGLVVVAKKNHNKYPELWPLCRLSRHHGNIVDVHNYVFVSQENSNVNT
jgi:hypothetical protein